MHELCCQALVCHSCPDPYIEDAAGGSCPFIGLVFGLSGYLLFKIIPQFVLRNSLATTKKSYPNTVSDTGFIRKSAISLGDIADLVDCRRPAI